MTTVPTPDTPAPANNAKITLLSSDENLYVRPTAGGNAAGSATDAAAGPTPAYSISMAGNAPTGAGPDVGHGATIIVAQPDATGHPAGDAQGGGTVGNSGDQGAPPASTDMDFVSDLANPEAG